MSQAINRSKILNSNKSNKGSEAANAVISILKNGPQKI
jgi:6,7-dimethyl-8-ribityllumazine synthase